MENLVKLAMKKTGMIYPVFAWYDNEYIVAIITEAVKMGWVLRTSHTQVEWTEKGVQAVS